MNLIIVNLTSKSDATSSTLPHMAAMCSGVRPRISGHSVSTEFCIKPSVHSSCPFAACKRDMEHDKFHKLLKLQIKYLYCN